MTGPITTEQLREHPQIALVAATAAQLALLEPALAAAHQKSDPSGACEQARSMVRTARILQSQIEAYCGLLALAENKPPSRAGGRTRG